MPPTPAGAFDCPGNYVAAGETSLRCAKCNRPLLVKDARRTPTGYVCPYFVKARVATFYNANVGHYAVAGALSVLAGAVLGLALNLAASVPFFGIIITLAVAPAGGAAVAEVVRRVLKAMNNARGQYMWLVMAVGMVLGAAYFTVLPALALFLRFSPGAIFALIPLVGLVLATGTLIARSRI